ncbi:sulfatase-like hydrolase/transferase [Paraflavisolibacter sp. H34]|uniref:LTA synthase family protein n=1 Tax=Huijunlia imazamoxiresistens TaxID=3127457 RepID=UPI003019155C
MMVRLGLPKTLLWVINLLLIYLLMFSFFRLVTFLAFRPDGETLTGLIPSFILGLRFDLRWIGLVLLPMVLLSLSPGLSPFHSHRNRKAWTWYLAGMTFVLFFFFAADFGCFSYNKTRLNASALNFVEDFKISMSMLWQSYPLFWLVLALVVSVLLLRWMFRRSHVYVISKTDGRGIPYRRKWFVVATLLLGLMVYGNLGPQPLKWNNAFSLQEGFRAYLALNPLQNFFTTLRFRKPQFNEGKARQNFPRLAAWMGLPTQEFSYHRQVAPRPGALRSKPNVVLVVCESFSMYKSSMSGNPLNTTPYFRSLSDSGIFFERCFTPHFSTARGLFATITGIPDVQLSKFSTRNPQALDQHTIINNFEGYRKMYFLGGSPSFNNFEGLMKNVHGVEMFTEGHYNQQPVNVWGISDKELFLEANRVFARQQEPFFAVVQTADNHRPFTIPATDRDFQPEELPADTLKKYGFESPGEFNAFRYADYCFRHFIEAAKKEKYFDNTLFVFVGDHGVSGNATRVYPSVWTEQRLTDEHVPLLFYAPALLQPGRHSEVVSQIDVLPTIAGLAGRPYTNTTLGRDVLNNPAGRHYAFIIYHDEGQIGMMTDDYYFTKNLNFPAENLHFLPGKDTYSPAQQDSIRRQLSDVTTAFYETARWMLMNNKK